MPSRGLGNLAGALAIHFVLFLFGAFVVVLTAAQTSTTESGAAIGSVIGLAVVGALWLALAGLVVSWWKRGREQLWKVTLAWVVIALVNI